MDPLVDDVMEFILEYLSEVELGKERDKTRAMEEQLRTDKVVMEAKDKERSTLMRERDHKLAFENAVDKLVADFLQADHNNNFDAQKAMENQIGVFMSTDGGNSSNTGGSGAGVNGIKPEKEKDKDERAGMATVVGKKGDKE